MAPLTVDDAKNIIALDSEENKIAKAKEILAARQATEVQALTQFLRQHTGTIGVIHNDVYLDNTANANIIRDYARTNGLSMSRYEDIETAYQACKALGRLCSVDSLPTVPQKEVVPVTEELKKQHIGAVSDELTNSTTP